MALFELLLTDGTEANTINFNGNYGYCLDEWPQALVQYKNGGVYQDSPLAEGRRPVFTQFTDADEQFVISIKADNADLAIAKHQALLQLLNRAVTYWTSPTTIAPIYLQVQANAETNIRYALVVGFTLQSLPSTHTQPFEQVDGTAVYIDISLSIERNHWLANLPGEGSLLTASSTQDIGTWDIKLLGGEKNTQPSSLMQYDPNTYFAPIGSDLMRSTDGGENWSAVLSYDGLGRIPGGFIFKASNGSIFASDLDGAPNVSRSLDAGTTWVGKPVLDTPYQMFEDLDGNLYICGTNLQKSTDNGDNWNVVFTPSTGTIKTGLALKNGAIIITSITQTGSPEDYIVYYSNSNTPLVFTIVYTISSTFEVQTIDGFTGIAELSNGIYITSRPEIAKSTDGGITWSSVFTVPTPPSIIPITYLRSFIIQTINGNIYAALGNILYVSSDLGSTWIAFNKQPIATSFIATIPTLSVGYVLEDTDNNLWVANASAPDGAGANYDAGSTSSLQKFTFDAIQMGNPECTFVANKQNTANLTNIKLFNSTAVTYTEKFPITASFDLFPATIAVGDIVYINSADGTYTSLVLNLEGNSVGLTYTYEYWDGGTWSTLTITDNSANTLNSLAKLGIVSIHWEIPTDWVTTTIDSDAGFWIRLRILTVTGTPTSPIQANDQIYTVVLPHIEIAEDAILGDLAALANIKIINVADKDGVTGGLPDLYDNRVLLGLKSISGTNELFTPYINASDTQNSAGIITTLGTNTAFQTDVIAPTTKKTVYTPVGIEALASRLKFTFSSLIARSFYGSYRLFLRCKQTSGVIGDIFTTIVVQSGSGGIQATTPQKTLPTLNDWQLLNFGIVNLPSTDDLLNTDLTDELSIDVQVGTNNASATFTVYDLLLLPVEDNLWSGEFKDTVNIDGSEIKGQYSLNVDAITNPAIDFRSLIRDESTGLYVGKYQAISSKPILPYTERFRLYIITAKFGANDEWVSEPFNVHKVEIDITQRYFAARGDN